MILRFEGGLNPSPDFQSFLTQWFDDFNYRMRREYDLTILDRLFGEERNVAIEMVEANLPTGKQSIVDAAVRLKIQSAVPALQELLVEQRRPASRFSYAKALYELGVFDSRQFFAVMEAAIRDGNWFLSDEILRTSLACCSYDNVRILIDVGLRRDDRMTRCMSYKAAVTLNYMRATGRPYDEELRIFLSKITANSFAKDAPRPTHGDQLAYYVDDEVYRDKPTFDKHLVELWNRTDPGP